MYMCKQPTCTKPLYRHTWLTLSAKEDEWRVSEVLSQQLPNKHIIEVQYNILSLVTNKNIDVK